MDINELKLNRRLIEVRTAYALNRIYNYVNRKNFKEHMILLESLVESLDENNKEIFLNLVKASVGENILGASKKEIYASMKVLSDNKTTEIARKLGISKSSLYRNYADLANRDFINDDFVESLKPSLSEQGTEICKVINNFIDNFNYLTGDDYYEHYDHFRSIELEFLIIYNKIVEILGNPRAVDSFLFKLCMALEIDWSTISTLVRGISFIARENTNQIMGKQQTRQEIFNLFYLKGFTKGEIGKNIFGKNGKIFYARGYEKTTKDITKNEWEFSLTYTPTLDWTYLNKNEVLKFISLFKGFVNADL
jgi:hypothetical protein